MLNNRLARPVPTMPAMISARKLVLIFALCVLTHASEARAEPVPSAFRAAILLRSLGYERGVSKGQGELIIAVVSGPDALSRSDARDMQKAFEELSGRLKIAGRTVRVRGLQHTKLTTTLAQLRAVAPAAVYFARGLEGESASLAVDADSARWVPMCADGALLGAGCALGVRSQGDASQLVIDLKRSERAGLSFDPRMLRLSHVIR